MAYNDGAGPMDQKTCIEMANRFENWMEHHAAGHSIDSDLRTMEDGRLVTEEEIAENPDVVTESAFGVEDDHLKEWIEFLRHCGGFAVW